MQLVALVVFLIAALPVGASPIVLSAVGSDAASITPTVDLFRTLLGPLNPNLPDSFAVGRREISWDGTPEAFSSPNPFPGDFFNATTPGRARGITFSTPGTEFQVNACGATPPSTTCDPSNPGFEYQNLNPSYPALFAPFSPARLFTPVGSTVTDVRFFLPSSTTTPTTVTGFGVVFTDVDAPGTTIQLFGSGGAALGGPFNVPSIAGNETFSFLGVLFRDGTRIESVRITSGTQATPGSEGPGADVVVMDDFIYGEPGGAPIPEPSTVLLSLAGLAGVGLYRLRRA